MRIVALSLLLMTGGASAATVVDCGRLLDVKAGVWRDKVSIEIDGGKVAAVKPMYEGAGHTDLRAYSCLPGLMDMHVHLTGETAPAAERLRAALSDNPGDSALRSVPLAAKTLQAGFTTVRDLGADHNLNTSLKKAIEMGYVAGPRIFSAGKAIATTGGHADPTNGLSDELLHGVGQPRPEDGVINSPEEARQAVRQRYKEGADVIKVTATGGVLSLAKNGQNPQFMEDELRAIVLTAKDYGFRVAAHAHGAEGIKRALRAGVDSIEHGTYMDDEAIALFKKNGAWYVPTISAGRYVADKAKEPDYFPAVVRPKAAAIGPLIQGTFARAYKAGVKIAFGTDAAVFPHGDNAKEFQYMVEAGMPALEAIRSATLSAAELLDQSANLGQVAPGFAADIVAVKGDPLQDVKVLQQMQFVMKAGVVYRQPH